MRVWLKSTSSIKYSTLTGASELAERTFLYFSMASNILIMAFLESFNLNPPDCSSNKAEYFSNTAQSKSRAPNDLSFTWATIYAFSLVNDPTNADVFEWPKSTNATYLGFSASRSALRNRP